MQHLVVHVVDRHIPGGAEKVDIIGDKSDVSERHGSDSKDPEVSDLGCARETVPFDFIILIY